MMETLYAELKALDRSQRAKDSDAEIVILLHDDETIGSVRHMQRLARLIVYLDLSRREVPDWLLNTFYGFGGEVRNARGAVLDIDVDELYDAFNDEGDFRWISDLILWTRATPKQRAQGRVLARLRYLTMGAAVHEFRYGFRESLDDLSSHHRVTDRSAGDGMRPQRQCADDDNSFSLYIGAKGDEVSLRRYIVDHGFVFLHFTRDIIRRRYAKWLVTYLFPLAPRSFLQTPHCERKMVGALKRTNVHHTARNRRWLRAVLYLPPRRLRKFDLKTPTPESLGGSRRQ